MYGLRRNEASRYGSWELPGDGGKKMSRTLEFTVIGEPKIHCGGCEQRIGNALRRFLGVEDVQASVETQRVVVGVDPAQVTPDEVRAKLGRLGYRVQPGPDRAGARPLVDRVRSLRPTGEAGMRRPASERSSL